MSVSVRLDNGVHRRSRQTSADRARATLAVVVVVEGLVLLRLVEGRPVDPAVRFFGRLLGARGQAGPS